MELVLISLVVFCAVVLGVQAVIWLYSEQKQAAQAVNRRLSLAEGNDQARKRIETLRRERGLSALENGRWRKLDQLLTQTGLRLNETKLGMLVFAASLLCIFLFSLVFGFGFISFALGVLVSLLLLIWVGMIIRRRRIARFAEQLPDALDVIVRGVKAGYPFVVALGLVSKEMTDPIGSEFSLMCEEIAFGSDPAAALQNLYLRVGEDELNYLTMAIKIQGQTGGNLSEVLARLSKLMRERAMLKLKVHSITAESRLSGVFLSLAPFVLFGAISLLKPDYFTDVAASPLFAPIVLVGVILLLIGNLTIYKMVHFKV